MKILFVIPELSLGGAERQLISLAETLQKLGHRTRVVVLQEAKRGFTLPVELDVRILHAGPPHRFATLLPIFREIRSFRPDVLHTCLFGFDLWTNLAARLAGVRCVISTRRELATWRKPHHLLWQNVANKLTDAVVTNSLAAAEYTCSTERCIDRGRIHTIPNALIPSSPPAEAPLDRSASHTFLYVANLWAGKGHDLLIKAFAKVFDSHGRCELWLAGEGPQGDRLKQLARDLGIYDNVRFLGRRNDIEQLMSTADIYVHASQMESSPNAILEAMQHRLPIVAFGCGGVPELLDGGELGRVVDVAHVDQLSQALVHAIDNPAETEALAEKAQSTALERHDPETCANAYVNVYEMHSRDPAFFRKTKSVALYTIGDIKAASTRYRALQYVPYFQQAGFHVVHFPLRPTRGGRIRQAAGLLRQALTRHSQLRKAGEFDLLFVQKGLTPVRWRGLVSKLIRANRPIVYDIDDAVHLATPICLPGVFRVFQDLDEPTKLLCAATCVLAGNEFLASHARERATRVEVLPTVVDTRRYWDRTWRNGHVSQEKATIVWSGQQSTLPYLLEILPYLDSPDLQFRVISDTFHGLENAHPHQAHVERVTWSLDREILDLAEGDFGVMPLRDDDWAKGKCGFKAIQYMALGKPAIAADVGVNREIVSNGSNGLLVSAHDDWSRSVRSLAENPERVCEMGRIARQSIREHYDLAITAPRLVALLRQLTDAS